MDFDWMTSKRVPTKRGFDAMYVDELRDQASLLKRLGFDRAEAARRLKGNIQWEFDSTGASGAMPAAFESIDKLVGDVFGSKKKG